jgi:cation diffusion facilitator family transporter
MDRSLRGSEISQRSQRFQATRQAAIVGALVNILLAVAKILIGVLGQSQALVADGVHSVSDLLTDALVYFAAHHAQEGPDAEHPYGHDRFETAATMGLGIVLVLVAIGIGWNAAERLFHPAELLQPAVITLYVALFSIVVKEALYRYTVWVARRVRSNLLLANAWHHRSDAVSSIVVLVGIGGTLVGLPYLDAIAAVGVGLMIMRIGWDLGWKAMQELVDVGLSEERVKKIQDTILSVGGVRAVHMLRTRKMGGRAVADVHVLVEPWLSVSEGHRISDSVSLKLIDEVDELNDVTVHIDPEDDEKSAPSQGLPLRTATLRLLEGLWKDLPCADLKKRVVLHYLNGRINIEVFFPLKCYENPQQAHELEGSLQAALSNKSEFGAVRIFFG